MEYGMVISILKFEQVITPYCRPSGPSSILKVAHMNNTHRKRKILKKIWANLRVENVMVTSILWCSERYYMTGNLIFILNPSLTTIPLADNWYLQAMLVIAFIYLGITRFIMPFGGCNFLISIIHGLKPKEYNALQNYTNI